MMEKTRFAAQSGNPKHVGRGNGHSHGKEYYRQDLDFNKFAYDGRIYYLNCSNGVSYLCSSDFQGEDIRILFSEKDPWFARTYSICVNETGIYLYSFEDGEIMDIRRIDFDGKMVCKKRYKEHVRTIYIYDDKVYYASVAKVNMDGNIVELEEIKCLDMTAGKGKILYQWASSIDRLFVNQKYIVFHAEFCYPPSSKDSSENIEIRDDGWFLLGLEEEYFDCLSISKNSKHTPLDVFCEPELYIEGSDKYVDERDKKTITFVDMERKIFWVEKYQSEDLGNQLRIVRLWEPRKIWGNRERVLPGLKTWKILEETRSGREYFDGTHRYLAPAYHTFKSVGPDGETEEWGKGTGHGECDKFTVFGDFLFLNADAWGEEQYPLQKKACSPIRKSWFSNPLLAEVIEEYENRGKRKNAAGRKSRQEERNPLQGFGMPWEEPGYEELPPLEVEESGDEEELSLVLDDLGNEEWPPLNLEEPGNEEWPPLDLEESGNEEWPPLAQGKSSNGLTVIKKIGETDVKYKICTFGAKFHIGFGVPVTIVMNGKRYFCKTHKTTKGRIDGLKQLYEDNGIVTGDELQAVYSETDHTIFLEKI